MSGPAQKQLTLGHKDKMDRDPKVRETLSLGSPEGFLEEASLILCRPVGQSALLGATGGWGAGRNAQSRKPGSILNLP